MKKFKYYKGRIRCDKCINKPAYTFGDDTLCKTHLKMNRELYIHHLEGLKGILHSIQHNEWTLGDGRKGRYKWVENGFKLGKAGRYQGRDE